MDKPGDVKQSRAKARSHRSFRMAVWRGVGIMLPPVLTVVIFIWVGGTINRYFLEPITVGIRDVITWRITDVQKTLPGSKLDTDREDRESSVYIVGDEADAEEFKRLDSGEFVPHEIFYAVKSVDGSAAPQTSRALYRRYVEIKYLQPYVTVPLTLAIFVALMYLLGRFMAAGIGRVFWNLFERGIHRLPVVRNVYSSVKQVTDFMFTEGEVEYTRVVAVEYPRKGIWSLGLVTGESMLDIRDAAGEPVLSVLIPSSPMPVTGYTITVLKSETVDLNITIDQAFQFCISCGVVVPDHQMLSRFAQPAQLPRGNGSGPHQAEAAATRAAVSSSTREQD